eukprot:487795-Amphidinium_carterae.1
MFEALLPMDVWAPSVEHGPPQIYRPTGYHWDRNKLSIACWVMHVVELGCMLASTLEPILAILTAIHNDRAMLKHTPGHLWRRADIHQGTSSELYRKMPNWLQPFLAPSSCHQRGSFMSGRTDHPKAFRNHDTSKL